MTGTFCARDANHSGGDIPRGRVRSAPAGDSPRVRGQDSRPRQRRTSPPAQESPRPRRHVPGRAGHPRPRVHNTSQPPLLYQATAIWTRSRRWSAPHRALSPLPNPVPLDAPSPFPLLSCPGIEAFSSSPSPQLCRLVPTASASATPENETPSYRYSIDDPPHPEDDKQNTSFPSYLETGKNLRSIRR